MFIPENEIAALSTHELEEINNLEKEQDILWKKTSLNSVDESSIQATSMSSLELPISNLTQGSSLSRQGLNSNDESDAELIEEASKFLDSAPNNLNGDPERQLDFDLQEQLPATTLKRRAPTSDKNVKRLRKSARLQKMNEEDDDVIEIEDTNAPVPVISNIYSKGQSLFQRGSGLTSVVGRDSERQIIKDFVSPRLQIRGKGALYISGLPGTGKSALLHEVIQETVQEHSAHFPIRMVNINCMTMENAVDIFTSIHRELVDNNIQPGVPRDFQEDYDEGDDDQEDDARKDIITHGQLMQDLKTRAVITDLEKRLFSKKHKRRRANGKHAKLQAAGVRHIFILDELDSIMTKDQEVLFRIFQWAFARDSSLILFGIANALDLTDRFLPRLRSSSLTPHLLPFKPYSDHEIIDIISKRLWTLAARASADFIAVGKPPLMDVAAITLCAKKTAANTGDLRKAFDICRRTLEIIEEDVRRRYILEEEGGDSLKTANDRKRAIITGRCSQKMAQLTVETAPRASIAHIARVCAIVFGTTSPNRINALNLQQKAVLCTLVTSERIFTSRNLTVARLYDRYTQACDKERDMMPLGYPDFMDVVSILESHGVAAIYGICGRKGLGTKYVRRSRGGSGSGGGGGGKRGGGIGEDFGQRRISSTVHYNDLIKSLGKMTVLQPFLKT